MKFDYARLRGRIVEKFGKIESFVPHSGRSATYVSNVLNGKTYLTQADIKNWAHLLDLDDEEIGRYFFASSELT